MTRTSQHFSLLFGFLLSGLVTSNVSWAVTTLKAIQVKSANEVELRFDEKINSKKITTEYLGDIFQINLSDVSIYPAKMIPVNSDAILKVFAYQYSPTLVRCRFTFKGKSTDFKDQIQVNPEGKSILFKLTETKNALVNEAVDNTQEDALLEKVMKAGNVNAPEQSPPHEIEKTITPEKPALTAGKPLPSILPAFLKLVAVLLLFLISVFAFKKIKTVNPKKGIEKVGDASGFLKSLGRMAKGTLSQALNSDGRMIQVVATHHLGPKKSIVVAKVAGKLLVLGVSAESINLITQISNKNEGKDSIGSLEDDGSGLEDEDFTDFLNSENLNTKNLKPTAISGSKYTARDFSPSIPNATSRIKSRLEGLKPL